MTHELSHKTAWIFDLDGTLTIPVHDFAHMRTELGMQPGVDILQTLAATKGEHKKRLTAHLDELEAFYAGQAQAAQGVEMLISRLAEKGCQIGIFTRNTKEMAILSLEAIGVGHYFNSETIIGRDEAPHKPDPQGLLAILQHWQKNVEDSVMVGDFKFDLEAGRAAGSATVHIAKDEQRWPQLTDFCYSSLAHLCDDIA